MISIHYFRNFVTELLEALSSLSGCFPDFAQRPYMFTEALWGQNVEYVSLQQSFYYRLFRGPDGGEHELILSIADKRYFRCSEAMFESDLHMRGDFLAGDRKFTGSLHHIFKVYNSRLFHKRDSFCRKGRRRARTWLSDRQSSWKRSLRSSSGTGREISPVTTLLSSPPTWTRCKASSNAPRLLLSVTYSRQLIPRSHRSLPLLKRISEHSLWTP